MELDTHHGHKRLTLSNWHVPDRTWDAFSHHNLKRGTIEPLTQELWAASVFEPVLNLNAPEKVQKLFEVARGTMLYAFFYYPVMTLAAEQLYRVSDTALQVRIEEKEQRPNFRQRIQLAIKTGILPANCRVRWEATCELRNNASHPERQQIISPSDALLTLRNTADDVNFLFK